MPAVEVFQILMDDAAANPQAVYRSGQQIRFNLCLKLAEPIKCRGVFVEFVGSSYVHWSESRGSGDNKRTVHYTSAENYINQKVAVFTPQASGDSAGQHPAGDWKYPVTFQLPPSCPSSFEGGIGRIRYAIKANVDRPWKFDKYTKKHFTLIRDLDLNQQPMHAVGPFATEENFEVKCCRCCSCGCGDIQGAIRLNKRGFVPGESIHVTGEIHNASKTDVNGISLELYQRVLFHAGGKTRASTRAASAAELEGVKKGERLQINHLVPVTAVPSSFLEGCNNIELDYFLRMNADGGCCLSVKKECCDLVIGSIPLSYNVAQQHGFTTSVPINVQPGAYPPPPQYQQCAFGTVQMDEEAGRGYSSQAAWAPSYPVYEFGPPPQAAYPPVA